MAGMDDLDIAMNDYHKIIEVDEFESNLQRLKPFRWRGQTVLFRTWHWGKEYIWLRDGEGTHYMVRIDEDGLPVL